MKLTLHHFDLELAHTFTIARESRDVQPTLVVELEQDGHRGYGEATSNTYYGMTIEAMQSAIEALRPEIENHNLQDPEAFHQLMSKSLSATPFPLCALDQAAWDLFGKMRGQPVFKLWGLNWERTPPTNFTIGIDTIEKMVAKMQETPWPLYKVKLGTDHDLEIIEALREHTDARFRVDANCGWTASKTIELAPKLKALGVEFIEQPLPREQHEAMREVFQHCALPVVADESCITEADVAGCHQHFHVINIKLTKCGGLTPARRMIAEARTLGMKVMVGCMTESSVGISAIAQLLPLLDYVDMDGALLLKRDIARGVTIRPDGYTEEPVAAGNGVTELKN